MMAVDIQDYYFDTSPLDIFPVEGIGFNLYPRELSKSGKSTYKHCPKSYWYSYLSYTNKPFEMHIKGKIGLSFHTFVEYFDYYKFFHGMEDFDTEYVSEIQHDEVSDDHREKFISFMEERRERYADNWEAFEPKGLEVPVLSFPIRGFIDLMTAVTDENGEIIGYSIDEIKPSRKNYDPEKLRYELAFYCLMIFRAYYGEGNIMRYQLHPRTWKYERDGKGRKVPVIKYPERKLPILKWGCYYYETGEYWQEDIDYDIIEEEMHEIAKVLNYIKVGRFPTWNRSERYRGYMGRDILCEEYCDYRFECNMFEDGYSCVKCGEHLPLHKNAVHSCEYMDGESVGSWFQFPTESDYEFDD